MTFLENRLFQNSFILGIFILGVIFSFYQASNFSDGDAFSLILSYLNYIDEGIYNPSRGAYGHPIPELIVGYISYNLGTTFSNVFCFTLFFSSILIFFKTFFKEKRYNKVLFLLLFISNSYLFFENTTSSDYPFAVFFFSIGFFFLFNRKYLYCSIFFAFCIASRANFVIFIYPIILIFYLNSKNSLSFFEYIKINFIITIIGILFYVPVFQSNDFTLDFLQLPLLTENNDPGWYGGPELKFSSLAPRFIFKVYKILGVFSFLIFLIFLPSMIKKILKEKKGKEQIFLFIIFSNLLVFYFMPTKILILNPFIICVYLIIFRILDQKKIFFIILLNFLQWFVVYDFLDIKYKDKEICFAREAVSASFELNISHGHMFNYLKENKSNKYCFGKFMGKYKEPFINGYALKVVNK